MTITVDTNVWISALTYSRGKARELLELASDGQISVAISDAIVEETLRVLRDKFHAPPEDLEDSESVIAGCTHRVTPQRVIDAVPGDPDDNRILECAVASGSECIVTGDKDLLRLGQFEGIQIVRLADFLARSE